MYHGFLRTPNGTITTFDAPGAGTGSGQGTFVSTIEGINPAGAISGIYTDANGVFHGFVRDPDGTIATFDAPGAGAGVGQGTECGGINSAGMSPGNYIDSSGVNHGYVRAGDGVITTFDVPGAGTGSGQGTSAGQNNPADAITGLYLDANNVGHGFLRIP